ncbi:hypothetical protein YQE_12243, partial [Dendroctonus ponderosae]
MASFLLRCLRKANFFQTGGDNQVSPSRAEYEIGEMLLFNLQVLQFNAHEVYETRYTDNCKPITSRVVFIGVAIYLTASLFNHDCHPALSRDRGVFAGEKAIRSAVRLIHYFYAKAIKPDSFFLRSDTIPVCLEQPRIYRVRERKHNRAVFNYQTHNCIFVQISLLYFRHFVGKSIVLTSVRPLNPNEIIPENYGPVFTRQTLAERKRSLSSRYWFDCQCMACQQNWPPIGRGLENVSERLM